MIFSKTSKTKKEKKEKIVPITNPKGKTNKKQNMNSKVKPGQIGSGKNNAYIIARDKIKISLGIQKEKEKIQQNNTSILQRQTSNKKNKKQKLEFMQNMNKIKFSTNNENSEYSKYFNEILPNDTKWIFFKNHDDEKKVNVFNGQNRNKFYKLSSNNNYPITLTIKNDNNIPKSYPIRNDNNIDYYIEFVYYLYNKYSFIKQSNENYDFEYVFIFLNKINIDLFLDQLFKDLNNFYLIEYLIILLNKNEIIDCNSQNEDEIKNFIRKQNNYLGVFFVFLKKENIDEKYIFNNSSNLINNNSLPISPPNHSGTCNLNSIISMFFYSNRMKTILDVKKENFKNNLLSFLNKNKNNNNNDNNDNDNDEVLLSKIETLRQIFLHYIKHASVEYNETRKRNVQKFINSVFVNELIASILPYKNKDYSVNCQNTNLLFVLLSFFQKSWIYIDIKKKFFLTNEKFENFKTLSNNQLTFFMIPDQYDNLQKFVEIFLQKYNINSMDIILINYEKDDFSSFTRDHTFLEKKENFFLDCSQLHLKKESQTFGHAVTGVTCNETPYIIENQVISSINYSFDYKIKDFGCKLQNQNWKDWFLKYDQDKTIIKKDTDKQVNSKTKIEDEEKNVCQLQLIEKNTLSKTDNKFVLQSVTFVYINNNNNTISENVIDNEIKQMSDKKLMENILKNQNLKNLIEKTQLKKRNNSQFTSERHIKNNLTNKLPVEYDIFQYIHKI